MSVTSPADLAGTLARLLLPDVLDRAGCAKQSVVGAPVLRFNQHLADVDSQRAGGLWHLLAALCEEILLFWPTI